MRCVAADFFPLLAQGMLMFSLPSVSGRCDLQELNTTWERLRFRGVELVPGRGARLLQLSLCILMAAHTSACGYITRDRTKRYSKNLRKALVFKRFSCERACLRLTESHMLARLEL